MKFKLPKGITGFTSIKSYFKIPEISKDLIIKSIVDFSVKNDNYIFLDIKEPSPNTNYYVLNILSKSENKKYTLLFNQHYSYFCCLEKEISWCEKLFGNLPSNITTHLENSGFIYLSRTFLDKEFVKNNLSELDLSEKEQINYWKSKTLGEVIFNHYD